jgi:hypothetical protein
MALPAQLLSMHDVVFGKVVSGKGSLFLLYWDREK